MMSSASAIIPLASASSSSSEFSEEESWKMAAGFVAVVKAYIFVFEVLIVFQNATPNGDVLPLTIVFTIPERYHNH